MLSRSCPPCIHDRVEGFGEEQVWKPSLKFVGASDSVKLIFREQSSMEKVSLELEHGGQSEDCLATERRKKLLASHRRR